MADTPLRSLAKAYSKKNLELAAYREARAKFINGVLAGELNLPVNEYPPLIRPKADTSTEATLRGQEKKRAVPASPAEKPTARVTPPAGNKTAIFAGAAAAIIVLVVIGLILAFGGGDQSVPETAPVSTQPAAAAANAPIETRTLIRDFLAQRNWATNSNLDVFVNKWQALPADVRGQTAGTLELNQLTNAIYKQLMEERALATLGNPEEARNKQIKLIEFARQLGINDPRIALPDG